MKNPTAPTIKKYKFKKTKISTSDHYHDLFEGGYIKPEEILKNQEDVDEVNNAIKVIRNFLDQASDKGILEFY